MVFIIENDKKQTIYNLSFSRQKNARETAKPQRALCFSLASNFLMRFFSGVKIIEEKYEKKRTVDSQRRKKKCFVACSCNFVVAFFLFHSHHLPALRYTLIIIT